MVAVVHGYVSFLKDENTRTGKAAAASRVTDARTREIELRIARHEGQFVPIDEHENTCDELTGLFLTMLSGLPSQISRDKRERDRIQAIIDENRSRLSVKFEKLAATATQN